MIKIITKEHNLYCIVNPGNSKEQMIEAVSKINDFYGDNPDLRNFKSDLVLGTIEGTVSFARDICKNYVHEMALRDYHEYRSNKEWTGRRA